MAITRSIVSPTGEDDYDTDTISVTSTAASEWSEDQEFPVEDILAEQVEDDGEKYFLIKWEGYGLHRCQWEPTGNVNKGSLLQGWQETKEKLDRGLVPGFKCFDEYNQRNIVAFEKAVLVAEESKLQRQEKRAKKRRRLAEGKSASTPVLIESSDDEPLIDRSRKIQSKTTATATATQKASLPAPHSRDPGKAPGGHGSHPEEEHDVKESHSIHREKKPKDDGKNRPPRMAGDRPVPRKTTWEIEDKPSDGRTKSNSTMSETTVQRAVTTSSSSPSTSRLASSSNVSTITKKKKPTHVPHATIRSSLVQDKQPTTLIRRSAPGAIKIVNQLPASRRRGWGQGSTDFYQTAHFWRLAELRSRNEPIPDITALQFVNAPSASSSNAIAVTPTMNQDSGNRGSMMNLYGLRDGSRQSRRNSDQQDISDHASDQDTAEPDEKDKVPLTCFNWKNGSCPFRPYSCKFLHRVTEHTAPPDGTVPPKFARPPLTCYFWFTDPRGCSKPADECGYAHKNTGWLAQAASETKKEPTKIDPTLEPQFLQPESFHSKSYPPRKELTCYFWFKEPRGCTKSADECSYAHANTGWLAPAMSDIKKEVTKIDPSLEPLHLQFKSHQSKNHAFRKDLTCPFWLTGPQGCYKSTDECFFAHENTGWLASTAQRGYRDPTRIDPSLNPESVQRQEAVSLPKRAHLQERTPLPKKQLQEAIPLSTKWEIEEAPPLSRKELMCWFWYNRSTGCGRKRCPYAHRNTGWLATMDGRTVKIDSSQELSDRHTSSTRTDVLPKDPASKPMPDWDASSASFDPHSRSASKPFPGKKMTKCIFYSRGICRNSEETCRFSHSGTRHIAPPPHDFVGEYTSPVPDLYYPKTVDAERSLQLVPQEGSVKRIARPKGVEFLSMSPKTVVTEPSLPSPSTVFHSIDSSVRATRGTQASSEAFIETSFLLPCSKGFKEIPVRLTALHGSAYDRVQSAIGGRRGFRAEHDVYSTNWRLWVCEMRKEFDKGSPIVGNIVPDPGAHIATEDLDDVWDTMNQRLLGAVVFDPEFTMVVFPAQDALWSFLDGDQNTKSDSSKLRFHILREVLPPTALVADAEPEFPFMDLKSMISDALDLDIYELFHWDQGLSLERKAFLLYHPVEHETELELVTQWLLMNDVEVFPPWLSGSWDCFYRDIVDGASGVVLIHSDINAFDQIPNYGQLLKHKVNMFQVGWQSTEPPDEEENSSPSYGYVCAKVQPVGGVIFITDDVWRYQPDEALRIVQLFFEKVRALERFDGVLCWRLATRPAFLKFLLELCEPHWAALNARDPSVPFSRWQLFEYISESDYSFPEEHTPIHYFLVEDEYPIMSPHPALQDDYDRALARSERHANSLMVGFYAQWMVERKDMYRHYCIVHTEPLRNVDYWRDWYQNIEEIMNPSQCIGYLENNARDQRFQYLDQ
ncbi:hypothetical protein GQ43DRAFT_461686 [Delitschia confertaspora ATCC 74209]|uniref:Chromo domain-containing protein n=1 Tax=Delitschia confertaspora ATCC 74209 TaxID=1513339 RepID=A0A9P4MRR6_9PLEO|nr:hypothetical protein GQ43DRAFT_461686 [Delitschia confertaspora ATCC 74209]